MDYQYFSHLMFDAQLDVLARYHTYYLAEFIVWKLVRFFYVTQNGLPEVEERDGRMQKSPNVVLISRRGLLRPWRC